MALIAILVATLALLAAPVANAQSKYEKRDSSSLIAIKTAFKNPASLASWKGTAPCKAKWKGVACGTYKGFAVVTSLTLPSMKLAGILPRQIGFMDFLTKVDLSGNAITGAIPQEFVYLDKLEVLNLAKNSIGGELPDWLKRLSALKTLNLGNNKLTGNIPVDLFNMRKIQTIYLNNNLLSGAIWQLQDASATLTDVDVSNNKLVNNLPAYLYKATALANANFAFNNFVGSIPAAWSNLGKLKTL
eukprot:TRINITY_DN1103_c0_g1_i3.p1 TRINITY_DN1103_c0_g1~~TRINITY_DN1103_c0_g1_i3.p1  ORF type:complete len:245 (-),score=33.07 TRINITY_DN1103_c0_g1_i3:682-1416(-)